jgi:Gamma tubulin complex component N-terminal/Gamma tubulin complex component C-terminal
MIHELLLVLSAHKSSIFKPWPSPPSVPETLLLDDTFPSVHPSERAALNNLAHLGFLHRSLQRSTTARSGPSIVTRAIVARIKDKVNEFSRRVEQIERMILTRDDSVVGALDVVPLARVSTLLGEWDRVMGYLDRLVRDLGREGTGKEVLERLRRDQQTGYPDIADVVTDIIRAGEEAWLRQVSSWVLYGQLPTLGKSDFFIQPSADPNISPLDENAFTIDWTLWPEYFPQDTATSILFIGRALARIQTQSLTHRLTTNQILESHLAILSTITFPILPSVLSSSVTKIRLSLSSSVLSNLLPLETIVRLVTRFRQDFLLGHGSLMLTLLQVTCSHLLSRRDGGTIKEAEVNSLLTKSWGIISRLETFEDSPESQTYQRCLSLSLDKSSGSGHDFGEFLLGESVSLKYEITWPLDLFLERGDVAVYNRVFGFLLAIKRAQGRVTSLWPGRQFPFVRRITWTSFSYALFFIDALWSHFQVSRPRTWLM